MYLLKSLIFYDISVKYGLWLSIYTKAYCNWRLSRFTSSIVDLADLMCRVSLSNAAIMLKKCLRTILVQVECCNVNFTVQFAIIVSSSIPALLLSKYGSFIPTGIVLIVNF